jgi:hypothetical protein
MRLVTDIKRNKRVFNLSVAEFKKGEWLKEIPDSDMIEITYKGNYLIVNDCNIKKVERKNISEKEEEKDGRKQNNNTEALRGNESGSTDRSKS